MADCVMADCRVLVIAGCIGDHGLVIMDDVSWL